MVKIVRVKKEAENYIAKGRLTIYSKWIQDDGGAEKGEEIILVNKNRKTLGIGFYENIGAVGVRLLKIGLEEDIEEVIRKNLIIAYKNRDFYPFSSKRIVNADADYMPGLIVDLYNNTAVIQSSSIGMDRYIEYIANIIRKEKIAEYVYLKNDQRSRLEAGLEKRREWIREAADPIITIKEDKALFNVDIKNGQKTGFFLDQRINRIELGKYGEGKKILDLFSYTGGFGVHLLIRGASKGIFVEERPYSAELLKENIRLNKLEDKADVYEGRVEKFLSENNEKFDIIIVDPPALVQSRDKIESGVKKYRDILSDIFNHITKGLIFISSCSYFIKPGMLRKEIIEWTAQNKNINIVYLGEVKGPSPDHFSRPIDKELRYLKAYLIKLS